MKKRRIIIFCLIALILVSCLALPQALADVGGGVDWDGDWGGGGDFDWGGGNDWDGGNDWGDSWGGTTNSYGNLFFFMYLFDKLPWPVWLVIFCFIIFARFRSTRFGGRRKHSPYRTSPKPENFPEDQGLDRLKELDPDFSKPDFLSRASTIFVTLQRAWTEKNWPSIRPFEADQLFYQHQQQLEAFEDKGQTNVVEDISVLSTKLEEFTEDKQNQYLTTILQARYKDYVVDDATGKVVKGDPKRKYLMTYRMTFQRKIDAKTESNQNMKVTQCPNCGANISIGQNGKCEYCGSTVTTGAYQWVLSGLQPLSQKTV